MKSILKLIAAVALLAVSFTPAAQAQEQYGAIKTLVDLNGVSWANAATTNFNAIVTATKQQEFVLEVKAGSASTLTGTIDIRWSTSADGSNFTTPLAASGASGWFAAPIAGAAGGSITWRTNIVLNSIGYWRADYITNTSGQTLTNFTVKAYAKPKRYGGFGP